MGMVDYFLPDWHLYHDSLSKTAHRKEGAYWDIANDWQRHVTDDDRVFVLGDVIIGSPWLLGDVIKRLPGEKFLIIGNHDIYPPEFYLEHGFDHIRTTQWLVPRGTQVLGDATQLEWDQDISAYLTHIPINLVTEPPVVAPEAYINICGHLHGLWWPEDPRNPIDPSIHKPLAIEWHEYKLFTVEDILAGRGVRTTREEGQLLVLPITAEQYEAWKKTDRRDCPVCGGGGGHTGEAGIYQFFVTEYICTTCDWKWQNIHTFREMLFI